MAPTLMPIRIKRIERAGPLLDRPVVDKSLHPPALGGDWSDFLPDVVAAPQALRLRRRRLIRPIAPTASRLSVPGSGTAEPITEGSAPMLEAKLASVCTSDSLRGPALPA